MIIVKNQAAIRHNRYIGLEFSKIELMEISCENLRNMNDTLVFHCIIVITVLVVVSINSVCSAIKVVFKVFSFVSTMKSTSRRTCTIDWPLANKRNVISVPFSKRRHVLLILPRGAMIGAYSYPCCIKINFDRSIVSVQNRMDINVMFDFNESLLPLLYP